MKKQLRRMETEFTGNCRRTGRRGSGGRYELNACVPPSKTKLPLDGFGGGPVREEWSQCLSERRPRGALLPLLPRKTRR